MKLAATTATNDNSKKKGKKNTQHFDRSNLTQTSEKQLEGTLERKLQHKTTYRQNNLV